MTNKIKYANILDLQLFAEGAGTGDGGTSGVTATDAASQTKGVKGSNPLADVKYGVQATEDDTTTPAAEETKTTVDPADRKAQYEAFIKEHKDLDDARVQSILRSRLEKTKETVENYEALSPTLEMLYAKYGVKKGDIKALNEAISADDSYYEEEALEKGVTVEQLKEVKKLQRENDALRRAEAERTNTENATKQYTAWMEQADKAKVLYPSLDLRTEISNPQFASLLRAGIDVKTAFEVVHKDEILPAAMQYAAQDAGKKVVNRVIANGARPSENGTRANAAANVKSDVSTLTKADMAEINRRVARGEKITFG